MIWLPLLVKNGPQGPICPAVCLFSRLCKSYMQQGISDALRTGRLERMSDCPYQQGLLPEVRQLGLTEAPGTAVEMYELVAERVALRDPEAA